MPDPVVLGTLSSATGVFSGFYQHFKPSKSPYLLSGMSCVFSIVALANLRGARGIFLAGFIPVGLLLLFLCALCFFFNPYKSPTDSSVEEIAEEIDEQFKFSRGFGVSAGVLLLTYLLYKAVGANFIDITIPFITPRYSQPIEPGLFFVIGYAACVVHLGIFVTYTMIRNIREESAVRTSLFQVAFFTMALLIGLVISCTKIHDQYHLINTCPDRLIYKENGATQSKEVDGCNYDDVLASESKRISQNSPEAGDFEITRPAPIFDPDKIVFWYLLVLLACFETYWLWRLKYILRVKFGLEVKE